MKFGSQIYWDDRDKLNAKWAEINSNAQFSIWRNGLNSTHRAAGSEQRQAQCPTSLWRNVFKSRSSRSTEVSRDKLKCPYQSLGRNSYPLMIVGNHQASLCLWKKEERGVGSVSRNKQKNLPVTFVGSMVWFGRRTSNHLEHNCIFSLVVWEMLRSERKRVEKCVLDWSMKMRQYANSRNQNNSRWKGSFVMNFVPKDVFH